MNGERMDLRHNLSGVFTLRHRPQAVALWAVVEDYPHSLIELEQRFGDEQACDSTLRGSAGPADGSVSDVGKPRYGAFAKIVCTTADADTKYRSQRAPSSRTATSC